MLSLCLCGSAKGNLSAYDASTGGNKATWRTAGSFGLLSYEEIDSGLPLDDALKAPSQPIYMLQ